MREQFHCDKCGLCCENLNLSSEYDDLNDGTGTCRYFDKETRLCTIYDNRPEKCNIEASFYRFKDKYTYEEYLELNYKACRELKENH
jgi:hypothetical protein